MKIKFIVLILLFSNPAFSSYRLEVALDNLDDAWSFVFLSEDKILFTEMSGKLKIASFEKITNKDGSIFSVLLKILPEIK